MAGVLLVVILSGITAPAYADTYYTVQPGDSLWKISNRYGTSVEQLQKLNALASVTIMPGQKLIINKNTSSQGAVSQGTSQTGTYYIVQPGDSLWLISKKYGTTINQLQSLNALTSSSIFPGQKLLIGSHNAPVNGQVSRGGNRADIIINYAKSFTGVPYVYGGQSPSGFDCSGYIWYVFNNFGVYLPRTASAQFHYGHSISSGEAYPGDLVAFGSGNSITHIGLYLGGGRFISATSSSGVAVESIYASYWSARLYGFSRIIPQ